MSAVIRSLGKVSPFECTLNHKQVPAAPLIQSQPPMLSIGQSHIGCQLLTPLSLLSLICQFGSTQSLQPTATPSPSQPWTLTISNQTL